MFTKYYSSFECVPILDNMFNYDLGPNSDLPCDDTLDEIILCDTFLYYLAYDDIHAYVESASYVDRSLNGVNGCFLDPNLWILFPFDPSNT